MPSFAAFLKQGSAGEQLVARWLFNRAKVSGIVKHCDGNHEGAPVMLLTAGREAVLPDLEVFKDDGQSIWIEVKAYDQAAYNRTRDARVHGISTRLISAYAEIQKVSGRDVWILILTLRDCELRAISLDAIEENGWECECFPCLDGEPCKNGDPQTYWPVSAMSLMHTFDRAELQGVDEAQAEIKLPILRKGQP